MGNTSSHTHEPLERGFTRGKFGDVKNGVGFLKNTIFAFNFIVVLATTSQLLTLVSFYQNFVQNNTMLLSCID